MRAERHVPEGLLRDSRRGSWIMIVPARDFVNRVPGYERRPEKQQNEPVPQGFYGSGPADGEARICSSEIYAVLTLAGLLSYVLWSVAHF